MIRRVGKRGSHTQKVLIEAIEPRLHLSGEGLPVEGSFILLSNGSILTFQNGTYQLPDNVYPVGQLSFVTTPIDGTTQTQLKLTPNLIASNGVSTNPSPIAFNLTAGTFTFSPAPVLNPTGSQLSATAILGVDAQVVPVAISQSPQSSGGTLNLASGSIHGNVTLLGGTLILNNNLSASGHLQGSGTLQLANNASISSTIFLTNNNSLYSGGFDIVETSSIYLPQSLSLNSSAGSLNIWTVENLQPAVVRNGTLSLNNNRGASGLTLAGSGKLCLINNYSNSFLPIITNNNPLNFNGFNSGTLIPNNGSVISSNSPPQVIIPKPTGEIRLYDGDVLLKTFTLGDNTSGSFTPDPGALAIGSHNLKLVYDGDNLYDGFSAEKSITISNTATTTSIQGLTDISASTTLNLQAVVKCVENDLIAPTGSVKYFLGENEIAVVNLGESNNTSHSLPAGQYTLRALYSGDATHQGSESSQTFTVTAPIITLPEPEIVAPQATKISVIPKISGKKLILSAILFDASNKNTLKGTIQWTLDGKLIGTSKAGKTLTLSPKLAKGKHKLVASFIQTGQYAESSKNLTLLVSGGKLKLA